MSATSNSNQVTGEITRIRRCNNSTAGNPNWELTIAGYGTYPTSANISDVYEIGNPGYREGDTVTLTLTKTFRIAKVAKAVTV